MIPKIIHYTWFSNDPYPEKIQKCLESWKKMLPDYELRKWDMAAIEHIDSVFMHEALSCRKWAYAADFVRLYAVYHEGGIYLDTDVEVYKSFDPLLQHQLFIGQEHSFHDGEYHLTAHCFGAEKGHPFLKECLSYYEGRHFIQSKNEQLPEILKWNIVLAPFIQSEIAKGFGYKPTVNDFETQPCRDGMVVYPHSYFDCVFQEKDSYCRHLAMGGWRPNYKFVDTSTVKFKVKHYLLKSINKVLSVFSYKLTHI